MQYARRLKSLQVLLRRNSPSSLLLTNPVNIRYLTGAIISDGLLFVSPKHAYLLVDGRYTEAVERSVSRSIRVAEPATFARLIARVRRCGYEEMHVTAARLHSWEARYKNIKFVHTKGLVEGLRRKKDANELHGVQRALSITNTILRDLQSWLCPGVTEQALAWKILQQAVDRGADGLAFETIVAFGPNTSLPHHHPTKRKLRARDIVQIDMGVRCDGYCSDRSEVLFVGTPTRMQQRVYSAVLAAKNEALNHVRAGVSATHIDAIARESLRDAGLASFFTHSLGHGVGLDIHERPSISSRSSDVLQQHDVITIEPGVYLPGRFGIRMEDTVVVP